MIHGLQRLMVLRAEAHRALGRFELHPLHRGDQGLGILGPTGAADRLDRGDTGGHAACGEEIRRGAEAGLMLLDQPGIHRVLRDFIVVIGRPLHAREIAVGGHRRQDVAPGRQLDAPAARVHRLDAAHRVATTGPDHEQPPVALVLLQRVEDALGGGGEIGGVGGNVFLMHQLRGRARQRLAEGGDAVAAKGVILRQRGHDHPFLPQRHRVRDRVLAGIAPGAEDVAVPFAAGDRIGHGGFDDQDALVFFGHGQHRQRDARTGRPDGDMRAVIAEGLRQQGAAQIGAKLAVIFHDADRLAVDLHRAAGGVFQPQHQAGLGLGGIGLQRAGAVVDMGDADLGHDGRRQRHHGRRGDGRNEFHGPLPDEHDGWFMFHVW